MAFHFQHALRAFILFAFAGFLFKLHYTGDIGKYINVKYSILSQLASVLFVFLFLIQAPRAWTRSHPDTGRHDISHPHHADCVHHAGHNHPTNCEHHNDCEHDHGFAGSSLRKAAAYFIIAFPLMTGFLLPPNTLDAAIASKKGARLPLSQADYVTYADAIPMFPENAAGQTIKATGFVYKEPGMGPNQLVVARFVVTHCVADAGVIGFLAEWDGAGQLQEDTWIEIQGKLDVAVYEGMELPKIAVTAWKKIQPPKDPYVYPQ